jgi:tetraprenyl-beta-curcumene synthase
MESGASNDPLPLSGRQVTTLIAATARELSWALPESRREARKWQQRAEHIPDESIRADALRSFSHKRGNLTGATLFTTLLSHRSRGLLQTLVAFQTIFDLLDDLHERHPTATNGEQLYLALVDALTPGEPLPDYYAQHPRTEDAGYLGALIEDCRRRCETLPSFAAVQPLLIHEANKARRVLALNHLPDPEERDRALRHWAETEFPGQEEWPWFELTAAASGQLAIFALLALAAKPALDEREVAATYDAYWPMVPLITTMLDSFVDQLEDAENGDHRYISHYREPGLAVARLSELIESAASRIVGLPDGHRHAVIISCMVAFYLTKDSVRSSALEPQAKQLLRAGGSLPRALAPVLRIWRTAYAQRAD